MAPQPTPPADVEAFAPTLSVLADEASWPDWIKTLVAEHRLRFSSDEPGAAGEIDSGDDTWTFTHGDTLIRFADGFVSPIPSDLYARIWPPAPAAAPEPPPAPPSESGPPVIDTHAAPPQPVAQPVSPPAPTRDRPQDENGSEAWPSAPVYGPKA